MARYVEHEGDEIDPSAAFAADVRRPAEVGLAPRVLGGARSKGGVAEVEMTSLAPPVIERRGVEATKVMPYAEPSTPPHGPVAAARLVSMDAFRGLVMVLMVSAGLRIPYVITNMKAEKIDPSSTWTMLATQTDHVAWRGAALWDFIQPSFMFMVGAAMAFSLASRQAKGQSFGRMLFHAIWRSALLIGIAIYLESYGLRTNWGFTNVLAQIGLGYTLLFLVAWLRPRWQLVVAVVILAGYWALFAFYPKPPADYDYAARGVTADWPRLKGFEAHWEKNVNPAADFEWWFLNKFPQVPAKAGVEPEPFKYNKGGYATLNFVPSLATMIFGLLAGGWLRCQQRGAGKKFSGLMMGGAVAIGVGLGLDYLGVCPLIKRIWTPSWAIFSAGVAMAALGIFYLIIDVARFRIWAVPLIVVGMNSIAIYCMSHAMKPMLNANIKRHFGGEDVYKSMSWVLTKSTVYTPMFEAGVFLIFCWAVVWWMYRRKIFIRI